MEVLDVVIGIHRISFHIGVNNYGVTIRTSIIKLIRSRSCDIMYNMSFSNVRCNLMSSNLAIIFENPVFSNENFIKKKKNLVFKSACSMYKVNNHFQKGFDHHNILVFYSSASSSRIQFTELQCEKCIHYLASCGFFYIISKTI